jgi:hypothetical protein
MEHGLGGEVNMQRVDGLEANQAIDISKEVVYTLEVAANRYDLLCLEGIS